MASTNTSLPTLDAALSALPTTLRRRLVDSYANLKAAWSAHEYDTCGLRAGKFCEVMLRCLQEVLTGEHLPFGTKIANFGEACRAIEKTPKSAGPEGLRLIIPRALDFVYTLRNKRDVGHVGGDVDANAIDAATAVRCVDWCIAELLRSVHTLSLEEAQAILDSITEREMPTVWAVAGKKRVLDTAMSRTDQTLVLLYSDHEVAVLAEDLAAWVEAPRLSDYRKDVLRPLHRRRLIEFDLESDSAVLSPSGISRAEEILHGQK
jgi:hypothetical protein